MPQGLLLLLLLPQFSLLLLQLLLLLLPLRQSQLHSPGGNTKV
jgi:hypothetical protein